MPAPQGRPLAPPLWCGHPACFHQPREFAQPHGAPAQKHDMAHYFTRGGDYGSEFVIQELFKVAQTPVRRGATYRSAGVPPAKCWRFAQGTRAGRPCSRHRTGRIATSNNSWFGISVTTQTVAQSTDFVAICTDTTTTAMARFDTNGHLTLQGAVVENTYTTASLTNAVVILRDNSGGVLSFVDRSGNLKVKRSVYVAENADMPTRKFD